MWTVQERLTWTEPEPIPEQILTKPELQPGLLPIRPEAQPAQMLRRQHAAATQRQGLTKAQRLRELTPEPIRAHKARRPEDLPIPITTANP